MIVTLILDDLAFLPCVKTMPPFLSLGPEAKKADIACCNDRGRPVKRLSLKALKHKTRVKCVLYVFHMWTANKSTRPYVAMSSKSERTTAKSVPS